MIIILHGGNGKKEKHIEKAYDFVKKGFFVTLFDAYGHGELKSIDNTKDFNIDNLLKCYLETTKSINIISNSYEDNIYGDLNRIGLMGISMGAHTIYYNILKERKSNIKAAVPINGSPCWITFVRRYINNISDKNLFFANEEIIKLENYMKNIHPLSSKGSIDFPLLMLNGEKDNLIPIDVVKKSYNQLKETYTQKELIKIIEYKDTGHIVIPEMLESACNWFKKYL
ncbi:alpha/beta hydrolase family protein [Clostridium sp.]|uniref:alpha/beta hydrolase family protein n=1 Tax=Clostridium sp. TaxID=1506 RepID=UPI0034644F45